MTHIDEIPELADVPVGRAIASYRDARAAALAVKELEDRGFDTDVVTIHPAGLSMERHAISTPSPSPRTAAQLAAVMAAVGTIAAELATTTLTLSHVFLAVLLAAMLAALASGIAWLAATHIARRRAVAATYVRATRFDVVAARDADHATHLLARWWDPSAPPARSRRGAHTAAVAS